MLGTEPNEFYLKVSFKEKDKIKELKGRWDSELKSWHISVYDIKDYSTTLSYATDTNKSDFLENQPDLIKFMIRKPSNMTSDALDYYCSMTFMSYQICHHIKLNLILPRLESKVQTRYESPSDWICNIYIAIDNFLDEALAEPKNAYLRKNITPYEGDTDLMTYVYDKFDTITLNFFGLN